MNETKLNPFGEQRKAPEVQTSDEKRAEQEIQTAMVIAKRFPRDQMAATDALLKACTRPTLAETAVYAFPRGGAMITGPSVRLAEAAAQAWGNLTFGVRELSQSKGESVVESFAWDLETNTKQIKVFTVKHARRARGATKTLDDPRDIYEMVANQAARRMRACILGVIPGDVIEAAVRQCEVTLEHSAGVPKEEIKKLVDAFKPLKVTADMLKQRLGHNLESTIAAEIISLRKIYVSMKDGMSKASDWFEVESEKRAGDKKGAQIVEAGDGIEDLQTKLNEELDRQAKAEEAAEVAKQ